MFIYYFLIFCILEKFVKICVYYLFSKLFSCKNFNVSLKNSLPEISETIFYKYVESLFKEETLKQNLFFRSFYNIKNLYPFDLKSRKRNTLPLSKEIETLK